MCGRVPKLGDVVFNCTHFEVLFIFLSFHVSQGWHPLLHQRLGRHMMRASWHAPAVMFWALHRLG